MVDMYKSANRHSRGSYARMFRWMCGVRPEDRITAEELSSRVKLISMR